AMSYEESLRGCPACRRETWHGRDVVDVYRSKALTAASHLITIYNDVCIPWRCLECGRLSRGKAARKPFWAPERSNGQ
ncbi:MAG: hypothetical protein LC745_03320, partial [Planctomycetia bacterium]|nr:hypothetical protein [Planctomycetia bacterium]